MSEIKRLRSVLGYAQEERVKNILVPIKNKEEYEFICDLIDGVGFFRNSHFFSTRNKYKTEEDEEIIFLDLDTQNRNMSFSRYKKFSNIDNYIKVFHGSDKKRPIVFNLRESIIKGKKIKLKI